MATITAKSGVIAVVFLVMCVAPATAGDKDKLLASVDVLQRPENAESVGFGCYTICFAGCFGAGFTGDYCSAFCEEECADDARNY